MAEEPKQEDTQNTQAKDSEQTVDWQKRYKDEQSELTRLQQKDKEREQFLETVSPFIDWEAAQGGKPKTGETPEGFVDRNEFETFKKELKKQSEVSNLTSYFRTNKKYDDLQGLDNEKLVGMYLQNLQAKTYPPKPLDQLLDEAVTAARGYRQSVKDEASEKQKTVEEKEKKVKEEKVAAEAATSGLDSTKAAEGKEEVVMTEEQHQHKWLLDRKKAQRMKI